MMTFYSAVGSYRIRKENGAKVPYIQKLGKLYPISVPEFFIWSTLLWEVMTHRELEELYDRVNNSYAGVQLPPLDEMLYMLERRKLIIKGIGYTGRDALYNMLSDAFVVPYRTSSAKTAWNALQLWMRGKLVLGDISRALRERSVIDADEKRVISLVEQTPLSTAELVRCFEHDVHDVSSPEKVIEQVYPEDEADQFTLANRENPASETSAVLQAVSNLYLARRVILETA